MDENTKKGPDWRAGYVARRLEAESLRRLCTEQAAEMVRREADIHEALAMLMRLREVSMDGDGWTRDMEARHDRLTSPAGGLFAPPVPQTGADLAASDLDGGAA